MLVQLVFHRAVLVRVWLTGRDLNTNNVLVYSIAYGTLNVRIADFGLSREMAKDTSMTGYLGSPSYIAPEVLTDSAVYDETVDESDLQANLMPLSSSLMEGLEPVLVLII